MPQLKFCLLGSPLIEVDHVPIETGRRKATALLAYLAVTNQPHSRDTLATLLWPDYGQVNARAALRGVLNSIRGVFGDRWLHADRELISLHQDETCWIDVTVFSLLVTNSQTHSHQNESICAVCIKWLTDAAEIYRDDFMAGFTIPDSSSFDEWQSLQIDQLRQQLEYVLDRLANSYGALHDYPNAIRVAQRWSTLDPFRESAHRCLMQLYAWSDQRTAAFRQYDACQNALNELGVSPEAATVALYNAIRDGTLPPPEGRLTLTRPFYGNQSSPRKVRHLPVKLTPFLARETELQRIAAILADPTCRLLTLTGLGGIGKTRLAIEAAESQVNHFAQGVCFVALTPIKASEFLVQAVAASLQFTPYGTDDLQTQLFRFLREKTMLLVLDNFEHLTDQATAVSELLAAAPHLKMLVTSREPLALQEEWLLRIDGMAYPVSGIDQGMEGYDAVQLFTQSARRVQPTFELASQLTSVVQICQLVEGMPLGIVLAAGNLYDMSCQQVAEALQHSLSTLTTSIRNFPERHRSLRATFEHSWTLLIPSLQNIFRNLSEFRGGFTAEAAFVVTGASPKNLQSLVEKSLIDVDPAGRYDLHEMLRQFAEEKLALFSEKSAVRLNYLTYFCGLAETAEARLQRDDQLEWLARLDVEQSNLRAALDRAIEQQYSDLALRLVTALWRYWVIRIPLTDGRQILTHALTVSGSDALLRARTLYGTGTLARLQGDYQAAEKYFDTAFTLFQQLDNQQGIANVITNKGIIAYRQGDYQASRVLLEQGLGIFRTLNDQIGMAFALHNLAASANDEGGDYGMIVRLYQEALKIRESLGDKQGIANTVYSLGIVAHDTGDFATARAYYQTSVDLYNETGDQQSVAQALNNLADIANREKDYETARILLENCLAIHNELGNQRGRAFVLIALSDSLLAHGDAENSSTLLKESLTIFHEAGERRNIVYVLDGLGVANGIGGNPLRAARLFGASDGLIAAMAMTFPPSDSIERDHERAVVRAQLGDATFKREYNEGLGMTVEDAVSFALD